MQFAIYVPNFDTFGEVQVVVELAKMAEAKGWDGFFVWDHLLPDADSQNGPVADPWIMLTALAGATQQIRLGALITPFPRRRPWKLARETVTLDHLSQGRLVVGAGIGGDWWREYSAVGETAEAPVHGAMLDEGLEILTQLWTGTPVSYKGTYYTLDKARFLPTPRQAPRIPIWIAGVWPGTRPFQRAARWDGVFPTGRHGDLTPQQVRDLIAYIHSFHTVTTPFDVVISGRLHEKPTAESEVVVTEYAQAGVTWWLESFWADMSLTYVQSVIQRGPPHPAP